MADIEAYFKNFSFQDLAKIEHALAKNSGVRGSELEAIAKRAGFESNKKDHSKNPADDAPANHYIGLDGKLK